MKIELLDDPGLGLKRYLYTRVYCSVIHKSQTVETTRVHRQVSIDRWINKMQYIQYTMEYYSVLKRKEILTHATTWMNLEAIMLSEISQSQKTNIV